MPSPTIPSRPTYKPFELVPVARAHLIIAEHPEALPSLSPPAWPDAPIEFWAIVPDSRSLGLQRVTHGIPTYHYRAAPHLLDHLAYRLEREYVGLHLYAIGRESFIWDVAGLARGKGMDRDEYHLTQQGSERRRVYCVHCRTFTENVSTNIAACSGCGAQLQVRDHFSQRLAAFMGVQIDAEIPGALPPIEEAFP